MRYIRTKEGIYCIDDIGIDDISSNKSVFGICKLDCKPIYTRDIVKQADTIEELCDCFIAIDKNGNLCENPMIAKGHCFKSFCNYYKANGIDVDCYLAILTDKGLIYVAKMNEKGELELL